VSEAGIEKGQKGLRWSAPQLWGREKGGEGNNIWRAAAQEMSRSFSYGEDFLIKLCT